MIGWDRGRPARKRATGAQPFKVAVNSFSRFALICGRDARGPSQSFERFWRLSWRTAGSNHLGIKRFFALDTQAYEDGALDKRTKELLGLVASIVLRCDDCITYHIKQSVGVGVTRPEFLDAFNVALVVGGSITIPHLRRAIDRLDQVLAGQVEAASPHRHD